MSHDPDLVYMQDAINRHPQLVLLRKLTSTNLGCVYLFRELHGGTLIVHKVSFVKDTEKVTSGDNPLKEIQTMHYLQTEGRHYKEIVQLLDAWDYEGGLRPNQSTEMYPRSRTYVVLMEYGGREFYTYVDTILKQLPQDRKYFSDAEIRPWFRQIIMAVSALHVNGLCHLDLKMENLVIMDEGEKKGDIKLIDLGTTTIAMRDGQILPLRGARGTVRYMAPEVFKRKVFNGMLADVYSLGVILFIMVTGFPPYDAPHNNDPAFGGYVAKGKIKGLIQAYGLSHVSANASDLLSGMMAPADRRLTLTQIARHPFVTMDGKSPLITHIDAKSMSVMAMNNSMGMGSFHSQSSASSSQSSSQSNSSSSFSSSQSSSSSSSNQNNQSQGLEKKNSDRMDTSGA